MNIKILILNFETIAELDVLQYQALDVQRMPVTRGRLEVCGLTSSAAAESLIAQAKCRVACDFKSFKSSG